MDFLEIALIFLLILLSIFLSITGFQIFFILRDLQKALKRLNKVLDKGEEIATEVEKPMAAAANLVSGIATRAKVISGAARKNHRPRSRRFYKKTL